MRNYGWVTLSLDLLIYAQAVAVPLAPTNEV